MEAGKVGEDAHMTPIEHGTAAADVGGDVDKEDQFDEQEEGSEGSPEEEERGLLHLGDEEKKPKSSSESSSSSARCWRESRFQRKGVKMECHCFETRVALASVGLSR
jgi:hypothetical protein